MRVTIAEYLGLLAVFLLLALLAIAFDVGLAGSTLLLVFLPCLFLWWRLQPPTMLLAVIAIFAVGSTLIWEAIAASNGLWYQVSDLPWRVFGMIPLELFLLSFVFNVFVLLLYEYFIDDRWLEVQRQDRHVRWLVFFSAAAIIVGVITATVLRGVVVPYAFVLLLTVAVATLGLAGWLSHSTSRKLALKALTAAALLFPFYVIHELVALFNTHVVYANPQQYLYSFELLGNSFPLEKILFFVVVPVWLVVVYELYLDDGE